jgi:hypothetical protein
MKGSKKTASGWKSDAFVLFLDGARTNERERERETDGTECIQFYNPASGYYVMNSITEGM